MKEPNNDLGNIIEKVLKKNSPSVSFESVWSTHLKNNRKTFGLKKVTVVSFIVFITLIALPMVGFAGYTIGRNVEQTDYPFVDDPGVIGKWESVDFVTEIDDFNPDKKSCKAEELYLTALVFIKDGEMLGAIENGNLAYVTPSWTKGMILNKQEKTASKYAIKKINGETYMFFEWKSGEYVFGNMKPSYYVLKKVNSRDYSNYQVTRMNEDKIDYPFVDDAQMKGKWESVDFIKSIDSFKPGEKSWLGDLFVRELNLDENGKLTTTTTSGNFSSPSITWTKGLIIHKNEKTASKCEIKEINGATYMFFEWKSGDYVSWYETIVLCA